MKPMPSATMVVLLSETSDVRVGAGVCSVCEGEVWGPWGGAKEMVGVPVFAGAAAAPVGAAVFTSRVADISVDGRTWGTEG